MSNLECWRIVKEFVVECAICLSLFRSGEELIKHFKEVHPGKDPESFSFWTYGEISKIEHTEE